MSPSSSNSIKVASLFSRTGVTAITEKSLGNAVALAVKEINQNGGVNGRLLDLEECDPKCDIRLYRSETQRLIDSGVSTIFGCYMSSTRKVTLPIIEQQDKLLFYPTFYEGFEFSPNCIYSGAVPNQNSIWLANYLLENYGDTFILVGSNYVFPYESNRVVRDFIANRNGSVLDEIYIPLSPTQAEIDKVIDRIKSAGPVVVISTIVGEGLVSFYQSYQKAGIDTSISPIGSVITGEVEFEEVGLEASIGHVTSAPYFSSIKSTQNARFVALYRESFGAGSPISAATEAAYMQVHLFAEAARCAGSSDRESILRVLPTFSLDAPQGSVRVSRENHHTYLWPKVAVVNGKGEFDIVQNAQTSIRPDPYLIDFDQTFGQEFSSSLPLRSGIPS